MKNRKGIIKMNKVVIQWINDDESLAKALFSNFFPFDIMYENGLRLYYGTSPLFRELSDNEEIPTYDFVVIQDSNSKFVFESLEEIKTSVDLKSENESLKKQIKDLKFQLSCYKNVANNCYGVFDNENDLNLVKLIEDLRSDNESFKQEIETLSLSYRKLINIHTNLMFKVDDLSKDMLPTKGERMRKLYEGISDEPSLFKKLFF